MKCLNCPSLITNDGLLCDYCRVSTIDWKARAEAAEDALKEKERNYIKLFRDFNTLQLRMAGYGKVDRSIEAQERDTALDEAKALAAELDKARGELTEWHKQYHGPNITHPDWCESWPSGKGHCTCGAQSLSHPSGERGREIVAELERLRGTVEALEIYRDIEYARAMKELDPTVQTYDQLSEQNEKLWDAINIYKAKGLWPGKDHDLLKLEAALAEAGNQKEAALTETPCRPLFDPQIGLWACEHGYSETSLEDIPKHSAGKPEAGEGKNNPSDIQMPDCPDY